MKKIIAAIGLMSAAAIAGCGGSGSSSTAQTAPVSGVVADGYLQNALVFLDKNGNYQLDAGEPNTTTDQNGGYTLNIDPADVGKYPIVAVAIKGQTIDRDTGSAVSSSYLLSTPAAGVSGTVSNFISPMSTLIMEKLQANPGMTLADAMAQLRNQLNMPAGMDMLGNYVAGAGPGQSFVAQYQTMHQVAQQMAGLMGSQSGLVMSGNNANMARFRSMMGQINQNLPQIASNAGQVNSTFMNSMMNQMQTTLTGIPVSSGLRNFSSLFRNMTSHQYFWNYSSGQMRPRSGMM
ncbi:hypothetical protein [Geobacter argillaceus]|uniref:Lipoprotein n=1 Tax=Geobacter argillaceus TaxID=345631 RepID=A0A562V865_9BACT|nr:hypothetical protein [Geobacter argillaceus]TWJ14071.1 hypothetical protein JN12_03570 [Geobacter argillaceus]